MPQGSYLFAYGRIKALESKLFSLDKFARMIDSPSAEEALKILYENAYGEGTVINNVSKIEEILENEKKATIELIRSITAEEVSTDVILIRYDYHNAKALMKEKYSKIDMSDSLTLGTVDIQFLKEMIMSDNYKDLFIPMRQALEKIDEEFAKGNRSPKLIDLELDRAMYKNILSLVKSSSSQILKEYVKDEIDLINIKNLLRIKTLQLSGKEYSSQFIPGGTLQEEKVEELVELGLDQVVEYFRYTKFNTIVNNAVTNLIEGKSLSKMEVAIDNYLLRLFKDKKILLEGIDPVLAYLLGKLTEIKNIRIIMISLNNNVDRNIIRERLRESYV